MDIFINISNLFLFLELLFNIFLFKTLEFLNFSFFLDHYLIILIIIEAQKILSFYS